MNRAAPSVTIVVRSHNEAPRLRLTLASLSRQAGTPEIVVVNDGSSDGTADVIQAASESTALTCVTHKAAKGRAAAANAGAEAASGNILLFLDGDTLAAPGLAEAHRVVHARAEGLIGRGETWHLRCTRFLLDPEIGTPMPEHRQRLVALRPDEIERMRITRAQILDDFAAIERRGSPGIYPGAGPRALFEREMEALRDDPACPVLWAAASGANLSVRRADFIAVGGFDEQLDINEHRELALRLCAAGAQIVAVEGGRTYHMTHRVGWRDPLEDEGWEKVFRRRHPAAPIGLLKRFWASFSDRPDDAAPIRSLRQLGEAAQRAHGS